MRISDLMDPNVISVDQEENILTAAKLMSRYNLGCLPVMKGKQLTGLCTDRDIVLRCIAAEKDPGKVTVREIMSKSPVSIGPEADSMDAGRLMANHQLRRLPVVEGGQLVGMLSLGDLAVSTACDTEAAIALSEISLNRKKP